MTIPRSLALLLSLVVVTGGCATAPKNSQIATAYSIPGIVCHTETRQDPPMRLFIAEIDLTNPRVHVRVAPGGPDPDGPGKWETTLMQPTKIAEREKFDLVVNGDFFSAQKVKNGEGTNSHYATEQWATVQGPAVTDGKAWAAAAHGRPCLVVHKDKRIDIETLTEGEVDDWEVIAGNKILVKDGMIVPKQSAIRNPRTAAGLNAAGTKLILLVIDGRKPGVSIGTSDHDTGVEMLRLGCRQALNLDGGGSSVMAVRDPATGQMRILNTPSDGHERPVGDVLGVSVDQP